MSDRLQLNYEIREFVERLNRNDEAAIRDYLTDPELHAAVKTLTMMMRDDLHASLRAQLDALLQAAEEARDILADYKLRGSMLNRALARLDTAIQQAKGREQ